MICLDQVAKFELVEMDDTIQNRVKVFKELIQESITETCSELLGSLDPVTLDNIKKEFQGNSFQISQNMLWKNGQFSYSNQLEKLPNLKNLIESKINQIKLEQNEIKQKIDNHNINSENIAWKNEFENELKAFLTEIILEALCCTKPNILTKKEAQYFAA
jgi:magnesium chelatase subunit I